MAFRRTAKIFLWLAGGEKGFGSIPKTESIRISAPSVT
jgi:hypothetical protein